MLSSEFSYIVAFFVVFSSGIAIGMKNIHRSLNRLFLWYAVVQSYMIIVLWRYFSTINTQDAEFWIKATSPWPIAFSIALLFALEYSGFSVLRKRVSIHLIIVSAGVIPTILNITGLMTLYPMGSMHSFGLLNNLDTPLKAFFYFLSFLEGLTILGLITRRAVKTKGQMRVASLLVLAGFLIPPLLNYSIMDMARVKGFSFPEITAIGFVIKFALIGLALYRINSTTFRLRNLSENALENMSDIFLTIDTDFRIVEINQSLRETLNIADDELIGEHFSVIVEGGKNNHLFSEYTTKKLTRIGFMKDIEVNLLDSNDDRLPFSLSITGSNDETGYIIVGRDIKERQANLDALRCRERFLDDLFNAISDGIHVIDHEMNIIRTNSSMHEFIKNPGEKTCHGLFMGSEEPCEACPALKAIETGESAVNRNKMDSSIGSDIWIETSSYPIVDEKGEVIRVINYCKNINEIKKAETELNQQHRFQEEVFQRINEGIFILNMKGEILFVNPSFAAIIEEDPERIAGKILEDFFEEELKDIIRCEFIKIMEGKPGTFEIPYDTRSRKEKIIKIMAYPRFDKEWNVIGSFGVVNDITEHRLNERNMSAYREYLEELAVARTEELEEINKQLQEEIHVRKQAEEVLKFAKNEAERANEFKSQLIFNVSHEMRTPLNCIIGFTEIVLNSEDVEIIHPRARTILQESENLLSLINDLLDHAKIEAGKMDLEHEPMDLFLLIESIFSAVYIQAESKNIGFRTFIDPQVPQYVTGDALRMRQILMNLVGNALKFTEKGYVKVSIHTIERAEDRAKLRFSVQDTGIGIPKDKQSQIFNSFTQADGSTTRKFGGTGLGTTISKQLVEQMEGEIDLYSEEGEGSTFWFVLDLPICSEPEALEELALANDDSQLLAIEHTKNGTILMAEDYVPNQEMATQHLEKVGYIVEIVENGLAAVKACRQKAYDLVLMDVQMPVMGGIDAVKDIRNNVSLNSKTPILAMTANADATTRKQCLRAGMNDVITKPIRRKSFLSVIDKWMNRREDTRSIPVAKEIDESPDKVILPIDWEVVEEEFGDLDVGLDIVNRFLETVDSQRETIELAIRDGDRQLLKREFHSIKGGAATIEAVPLSNQARELEITALEADMETIEEGFKSLYREYENLKAFVNKKVA